MGQALGDPVLAGEKEGLRSNGKKKRHFFFSVHRETLVDVDEETVPDTVSCYRSNSPRSAAFHSLFGSYSPFFLDFVHTI